MICLVLAAGYATRLYPLTENFPKPLLDVNGKPILDWLLDDLDATGAIGRYVVISNHKYAPHFRAWAEGKSLTAPIEILDDGTTDNENRLGAVKDIQFAIDALSLDDDLLVFAGDNVLDFSLKWLIDYFYLNKTTCIMRYYEPDRNRLKRTGVLEMDGDRVLRMTEKPPEPASHWSAPPFYAVIRADSRRIREAIAEGCPVDAPGSLIAWLSARASVHAMEMPGKRYDIGDLAGYERIKSIYRGIERLK